MQGGASSLTPATLIDTPAPDPAPEKKVETDLPTPSPPPPKKMRSWALRPEFREAASSSTPSDAPTAPPQQEEVNPFGEQIFQGPLTLIRELNMSFG
eukprot:3548077-Pyramimonas_sp.AAC.1